MSGDEQKEKWMELNKMVPVDEGIVIYMLTLDSRFVI